MKHYVEPSFEVTAFETSDVITTSPKMRYNLITIKAADSLKTADCDQLNLGDDVQ